MQTFQAMGGKGKPKRVGFFTLWFAFQVTTDAVQTSLHPLAAFIWGFLTGCHLAFLGEGRLANCFRIIPLVA